MLCSGTLNGFCHRAVIHRYVDCDSLNTCTAGEQEHSNYTVGHKKCGSPYVTDCNSG